LRFRELFLVLGAHFLGPAFLFFSLLQRACHPPGSLVQDLDDLFEEKAPQDKYHDHKVQDLEEQRTPVQF
jgi:hypothetical protein